VNVEFSILKEADREQIKALYIEGGWWCGDNDKNENFADELIKSSFLFAGAKYKGTVVGIGRVLSDGMSDAYIQDVVVLKEFRKRGIGSGIIKLLLKELIERKIGWIGLIAVPGAEDFYEEIGFEVMKDHTPFIYKKKDVKFER
jgi:ribosomal protein S18 acetylase RimI-like enzyme